MNAIQTCLIFGLFTSTVVAALAVEKVVKQAGQVQIVEGGKLAPMKEAVSFSNNIKVDTNGVFTVANGKERKLEEGQALTAEGMLYSPSGSVVPVFDHYVLKGIRMQLVKDGQSTPLNQSVVLADQSVLSPSGEIRLPSGRTQRLIEGQALKLDGGLVPSLDTATLKNGKVVVQKEGELLPVTSNITMNDGTRVYANGNIVSLDGKIIIRLQEGQTVTLPGAALAPR